MRFVKRGFDFSVSVIGLAALSPLVLALAAAIKLDSRGPVFYRAVRVGRWGQPFTMYKFRTMVVDADRIGGSSSGDDDPRITRVGLVLRRYKLDEIPQLLNIVRGDMSLVGPRPEVRRFTDMFTAAERRILDVRPGITDWASIWNSDEGSLLRCSPDPDRTYLELIRPTKLKLQLRYLEKNSFRDDIRILFFTLVAMIKGREYVVQRVPELRV